MTAVAARDSDARGWLTGVTTFNFHSHLPHYALTTDDTKLIRVLARQPIDMSRPHPFTEAGNREFNSFLWMPPSGARAGDSMIVIGAGPIGLMFMQVAALSGVRVIAVVKRDDQIETAKLFGVFNLVFVYFFVTVSAPCLHNFQLTEK